MKNLYQKISKARKEIKETKIEKKGENTFSKYKYFTPEQVELLVSSSCEQNGLLTTFNLKRNEFGEYGILTIIDIESGEKLDYEMASAIPEIKATNIAQQLGGCVTYTERYLKMSAFGISDNSLDFDTSENTKKTARLNNENPDYFIAVDEVKRASNIEELQKVWNNWSGFHNNENFKKAVNLKKSTLK